MTSTSERPSGRDSALLALDVLITALSVEKDTCGIPPAQIALRPAVALLNMIRDSMANERVEYPVGVYVKPSTGGWAGDDWTNSTSPCLGPSKNLLRELNKTVAEIQRKVIKRGKRNVASRLFCVKIDGDAVAAWRQDLDRILQIFNTELLMNNHMMLSDLHRNALAGQEGTNSRNQPPRASVALGESPPPPPIACFGRGGLIEEVVGLAVNVKPIAIVGAGGIGKTSIALSVLHNDRIKGRFGDNRRFIRCDEFPASRVHFLSRLSDVIGAGVKNPRDLTPLRPFLNSQEMFIIIDNAESILDPQGTDSREIYAVVDESCRFETISVCITSRITTVPRHCKRPEIPILSVESACDIFYGIYGDGGQSNIVSDLVQCLDFHTLSITLLATMALQREPGGNDRTLHHFSTFCKLGPDARDLLGVVAFFPQGIDEKNVDWLFPTISGRKNIFDKFCLLSLAYRRNGFITMLAPLRDYLTPHDPKSSLLLCATKDRYFTRLSVFVDPGLPGFKETRWIVLEDVNVEHLLDVFVSIDTSSGDAWTACVRFMRHLYCHKPRETVLKQKIEGLPDDHRSKSTCLSELAGLFELVGNHAEQKRLLIHALTLTREEGGDIRVAQTLRRLSGANQWLGLRKEGIQQVKEALEIFERLGNVMGQARCLNRLSRLLLADNQLDLAVDAASRTIDLTREKGNEYLVCQTHRFPGNIYHRKREKEKAVHHLETALEIASRFGWQVELFWIHHLLAELFLDEQQLDSAQAHVEQAKSHAAESRYNLGNAMELQAKIWYQQRRLEGAISELLGALEIFGGLGSTEAAERCMNLLRRVEEAMKG